MEPQTNSGQYSIVTLTLLGVVMLILSSAIGAILGPVIFPPVAGTQAQPISTVSANVGVPTQDVRVLFGTVKAIKGNSFTLHTQATSNDPLVDRNVMVTSETKIVKISQKDQSVLQSEITALEKKNQDSKKRPQLVVQPTPSIYSEVDASEINIGDVVVVTAYDNVSFIKDFVASEIEFRSQPVR